MNVELLLCTEFPAILAHGRFVFERSGCKEQKNSEIRRFSNQQPAQYRFLWREDRFSPEENRETKCERWCTNARWNSSRSNTCDPFEDKIGEGYATSKKDSVFPLIEPVVVLQKHHLWRLGSECGKKSRIQDVRGFIEDSCSAVGWEMKLHYESGDRGVQPLE